MLNGELIPHISSLSGERKTQRSLANFAIGTEKIPMSLIVKLTAVKINQELDLVEVVLCFLTALLPVKGSLMREIFVRF